MSNLGFFTRGRYDVSVANEAGGTIIQYRTDGRVADTFKTRMSASNAKSMLDGLHGRRPKPGKSWGGPLVANSHEWTFPGKRVRYDVPAKWPAGRWTYVGEWWPEAPWTVVPLSVPLPTYLTAMGTKGIAQAAPTRPQAGLTQFVAELKDIPKAPILGLYRAIAKGGRKKDLIRRAGNGIGHEYLNFEFGWRPLVADMMDFHKSTKKASKTIDQLLRDSGRDVKRRRQLRSDTVRAPESESPLNTIGAGPSSQFLTPVDKLRTNSTIYTDVWFEGVFTYYISAGDSYFSAARRNEQVLSKLYGTRFGIDTLWELTPWSWALDWVGNIGDVARNLAAFSNDGLVLKRGWIMYHQRHVVSKSLIARRIDNGMLDSTTAALLRDIKMRQAATPFGFGLSWSGFSDRQLAIAAALGLSRA